MGYYRDTRIFRCTNTEGFQYGHPEKYVQLEQTDLSKDGCVIGQNGDPEVCQLPKRVFDKYFVPAPMFVDPAVLAESTENHIEIMSQWDDAVRLLWNGYVQKKFTLDEILTILKERSNDPS